MSDTKAIWLHPYPLTQADRVLLVAAKDKLSLGFMVMPQAAFVQDAQGWLRVATGRVLCLREPSPMICDHAVVHDLSNERALLASIEWVLTDIWDERATLADSMWKAMGYKEIPATKIRYDNLSKNLKLNGNNTVPMFRSTEEEVDTGE